MDGLEGGDRPERGAAERYRAIRVLKQGFGIETVLAADPQAGGLVVAKSLAAAHLSRAAAARLEYEISGLGELGITLGLRLERDREGRPVQLVRSFVEGPTLEDRLGEGTLSVPEVLRLAEALLSTLQQAHGAGVLHRDVKPANIVFSEAQGGAPILIDFGIARHTLLIDTSEVLPVRAALYLSPEESGLLGGGLDARSDLYSVGVTLYEALSGQVPFSGGSLGEVLRKQLTAQPAPLRDREAVPTALDQLIQRLLRKDPRDRFQTAEGALADVRDLSAALARGDSNPELIIGAQDRRRTVTEPAFIGRERELEQLGETLREARAGRGGLALVEAESGGGKTWLLEELGRRALAEGARVLRGRGIDQNAQRPFEVLVGVATELVAAVHGDRELGERLRAEMDGRSASLVASVPELRAIFSDGEPSLLGPEVHGEARSLSALISLIDALGTPERPALILLDDGQWADESSLRLLQRWQEQASTELRHVAVVLTFRGEEVPSDHPLRSLPAGRRLELALFGEEEGRQQVASMAGTTSPGLAEAVIAYAGGNPFLIAATFFGLVEHGVIQAGAAGWTLVSDALDQLVASERVDGILALRIHQLSPGQRTLLSKGAILGRTFDPVRAGALAGIEAQEAVRLVMSCPGGLLWSDGAGNSFTFLHDKIRETLLAEMDAEERRGLHRLAAEQLLATDADRIFELAYHFDAAGDFERARPHAIAAAERARGQFALQLAAREYRIAERGAERADRPTRYRIASGLGEVLMLRGEYAEAETQYRSALQLAEDGQARALVEQRWALLELKRGDLAAGCAHGESALRSVGRWVPRSTGVATLWFLWEALVQVLHTYFPRLFVGRRSADRAQEDRFAIHLYHSLNGPYFFARGEAWAGWAHLRHLNLIERYPPSMELGRAYAVHPVICAGFPRLFPRALRMAKEGAALCERLGDPWGQAQALCFLALVLDFSGSYDESIAAGRKGAELFDRTGDLWEANTGLDAVATSLWWQGELAAALRQAKLIWQRASQIGDAHGLAYSIDIWARASEGRIPADIIAAERARSDEHVQTLVMVTQAEGRRLIALGRYAEAVELLGAAADRIRKEVGHFHDLNVPTLLFQLTALRHLAAQASPYDPGERDRRLRRAVDAAKATVKLCQNFVNALPHALRESGLIAAMQGDTARARRDLDESVARAEARGQRFEAALSREARAQVGVALGWAGAEEALRSAEEALRRCRRSVEDEVAPEPGHEPAVTLSLLDRFDTLLEVGRRISTALRRDAILVELRRAALQLLRAQREVVLERAAGALRPVHGDLRAPLSLDLAERAITEGKAMAYSSDGPAGAEQALGEGVRSALYVPIQVGEHAFGCLYVSHAEVRDLFDAEALRIADYLASLTGAALENAEGFGEIEARVEERTEQLGRANQELEDKLRQLKETQEQLLQAGKLAAVGTLIAGLSHELNNPVGIILGYVQGMLRALPEGVPTRAQLKAVERQTLRCATLVKALLDFSRTRATGRERVEPISLVAGVLALTRAQAQDREIKLLAAMDDALPPLEVCAQEIESALLNLIANALDATPPGGVVTLAVRAAARAELPGVEFAIEDSGRGIPENVRSRVFDPFFTTKPPGSGTGIGLSLTRQIVLDHDGRIDLESAEGQGTTMRLWLPATDLAGAAATHGGA